MSSTKKYLVSTQEANERIDKFISNQEPTLSRNTIQALLKDGYILVNETTVKANYKIKEADQITFMEREEEELVITPEAIDIDIVYQDEDLVVVDKTDDMVVHPGAGNKQGTLVNALLYHIDDFQAVKGEIRPGIVHRIDKETSGLLMVAKNEQVHEALSKQLQDKTVTRKYVALVEGVIPHNLGKITAPIGRNPKDRQKMAVVKNGKDAVTNFTVLKRFEEYTLVECVLETGRTHQIRVHMSYIGYPIVGDPKYGRRKTDTTHGQFLHAQILGFVHPTKNEYMEFTSPLPDYFQSFLDSLE